MQNDLNPVPGCRKYKREKRNIYWEVRKSALVMMIIDEEIEDSPTRPGNSPSLRPKSRGGIPKQIFKHSTRSANAGQGNTTNVVGCRRT